MPGDLPTDPVERARAAYARREWDVAFRAFEEADRQAPLGVDDLEQLGNAAVHSGRDAEMVQAFERVHAALAATEPERAARIAFWISARLNAIREASRAAGWLARARRLVEGRDCVEDGYLALSDVFRAFAMGDLPTAAAGAERAVASARRFGDPDLAALAGCLLGRARLRLGDVASGLALMDEVMIAVAAGETSITVSGLVYCNAIASCQAIYAVERAREWTGALTGWCDSQPELVPFSGACLVHRAEILRFGGAWPSAIEEARRAAERLAAGRDVWQLGDAHYERAEIHRLRGERAAAEEGYRAASDAGGEPHPGLALLRLSEGRTEAASAGLRRVLDGTSDPLRRARYLPAFVEVELAMGDIEAAAGAARELGEIAAAVGTAHLDALAADARGAVAFARNEASAACVALDEAFHAWQRLGAPYFAARTRVQLARACALLGDAEGAALHRDAARRVFLELGAQVDLDPADRPHGLTPRELEVLRHLASGKTNKAIARELFVSGKTVDRHVANLFAKLGVSSRAGATAWAFQNGVAG